MKVVFTSGVFKCACTFDERKLPGKAGFRWDNGKKFWYTPEPGVAQRLSEYLDASAKREIARTRLQVETWAKPLSVPKNESLLPLQQDAALFALSRNRSYLALDPGLGKTPTAAVIAKTISENVGPFGIVYICPPFLTRNTEAEFRRFAPGLSVGRYGEGGPDKWVTIVPDSIISRTEVQLEIKRLTRRGSPSVSGSLLFVDEAHRFKNLTAGRTKAVFGKKGKGGIASFFDKVIYLSGTPMPNRPIELFPVLSNAAPETIDYMSQHEYAEKYCAAFQHQWGWDYSGASNVKELVARVIGTFMIRFKKAELNLPPKIEEMVVLSTALSPRLTKLSSEILSGLDPEDLMSGRISADLGREELHLSTYRKELGVVKAKAAAEFIRFVLEETEENVLVFAIHKDVIASVENELSEFSPIVITGDTDMGVRHERVKTFQTAPDRRLFIGNIQAAGTGLTLTKATRVIFVEFSWVPADNDQASDRAHRIGQDGTVVVQYLVHENSVDKAVIETVLRKKKVTELL